MRCVAPRKGNNKMNEETMIETPSPENTGNVTGEGAKDKTGVTAGVPDPQTGVMPDAADPGKETKTDTAKTDKTDDPTAREEAYERMIKGEYKDLYDAGVNEIVRRRLKGAADAEAKLESIMPGIKLLAEKYGIDENDVAAINKAIENDGNIRENSVSGEASDVNSKAQQDVERWIAEEAKAVKVFPNLSLKREIGNPKFVSLIKSGIDVGTAYFAVHSDELLPEAMQYAAKRAEEKVTNMIRLNAGRPEENALSGLSSAIVKTDVSKLTKADRDEIARRVAMGEKIKF